MPHWEEGRQRRKKEWTQYRWTDTVIESQVLLEDKSTLLDEFGKSKVASYSPSYSSGSRSTSLSSSSSFSMPCFFLLLFLLFSFLPVAPLHASSI